MDRISNADWPQFAGAEPFTQSGRRPFLQYFATCSGQTGVVVASEVAIEVILDEHTGSPAKHCLKTFNMISEATARALGEAALAAAHVCDTTDQLEFLLEQMGYTANFI